MAIPKIGEMNSFSLKLKQLRDKINAHKKFQRHLTQQNRRWSNVCQRCACEAANDAQYCTRCGTPMPKTLHPHRR